MDDRAEILKNIRKCDMEKPFVFVSYSQEDSEVVWQDVLELQRRGFNVWIDKKNVDRKKETWTQDALNAIADTYCELVVFYVSSNSLVSEPCLDELRMIAAEQTRSHHYGNLQFVAVEVEPVDNIVSFGELVFEEIRSSESDKSVKHNKMDILNEFINEIFKGNNEKVRIRPWNVVHRKKDYYEEISGELPLAAKVYPECQEKEKCASEIDDSYKDCMELRTVVLPEGLEEIADDAFKGREDVLKVTVPSGVKRIGMDAFSECIHLESVKISEGITEIDTGAFRGCRNLREISLPKGLKKIGNFVFCDCKNLQSVKLPDSVAEMGFGVFQRCEKLKQIFVPKEVSEVRNNTFTGCTNLEYVILPEKVSLIGTQAFEDCIHLDTVWLPRYLKKIDYAAFQSCEQLRSITIPGHVEQIEPLAFADCCKLAKVTIRYGTQYIGGNAFGGCSMLKEISLPGSLKVIAAEAFSECDSLKSVSVPKGAKIGKNAFPAETKIEYYAGI